MGLDFMKAAVADYIAILSLPTLSLIGILGEGCLWIAKEDYSDNTTISRTEIEDVE